eukprot:196663_1
MTSFVSVYAWILVSVSLMMGLIISYWVWCFAKAQYQKERFIKIRKPMMIVIYCLCGSIPALVITTPVQVYIQIYYTVHFRFQWLMVFCHEFLFATMLTVISARCWLLHYDHSYGLSVVDQNWRGVIDPNDTDFWLRHRKTWGDVGFIVCFGVIVTSATLMLLSLASIWVFQTGNMGILPIVSMFLVALPACLFISILIFTGKLKKLYDQFSIIQELRYLSICTWFIVVLYIIDFINFEELEESTHGNHTMGLLVETGEVLFSFITSYIQCKWVFKAMKAKQIQKFLETHHSSFTDRDRSLSPRSASPPSVHITMAEVLRNKEGFGMFMRQCQNEMCVEGLLYIVEVAQYKSKIQQYEKNRANRKSLRRQESGVSTEEKSISKQTAETSSHSRTDMTISSTTDPDAQVLPPLSQVTVDKLKKDDVRFEQFRGNILARDWLPISGQLTDPRKRAQSQSDHENIVHFKPNTLLEPIQFTNKKDQFTNKKDQSPKPTPQALTLANGVQNGNDEKDMGHASASPTPEPSEMVQQTNKFLYNYAKYLFLKYIDVDSDFAVNVSHHIHKQLLIFFSADPTHKHYKKLYRIFDPSVAETWNLLANDTFRRFKNTAQYQHLLNKLKTVRPIALTV